MLRLEKLSSGYGNGEVLHNISLEVPTKSAVTILGRNGAGKTTTLRSILGLCRQLGGSVTFNGTPLNDLAADARARRGLALVPDDRGIFASLSVRENLEIAQRKESRWKMADIYDMFPRLKERESNAGNALSGGEQQMLAIGRALLTDPQLVLLDEPTEGLAPIVVEQIVEVIKAIRKAGVSLLIVEQNLNVCLAVGDLHYIMEDGQIVYSATTSDFHDRKDLHEKYLGV
jgi:branched-chain amino acid transport system ATP-binding protein